MTFGEYSRSKLCGRGRELLKVLSCEISWEGPFLDLNVFRPIAFSNGLSVLKPPVILKSNSICRAVTYAKECQIIFESLTLEAHVILATQEADIRRIVVRSQPWQIVH
jgi:hypothetical protein